LLLVSRKDAAEFVATVRPCWQPVVEPLQPAKSVPIHEFGFGIDHSGQRPERPVLAERLFLVDHGGSEGEQEGTLRPDVQAYIGGKTATTDRVHQELEYVYVGPRALPLRPSDPPRWSARRSGHRWASLMRVWLRRPVPAPPC
jgi:hypothetical protein